MAQRCIRSDRSMTADKNQRRSDWYAKYLAEYMDDLKAHPEQYEEEFLRAEKLIEGILMGQGKRKENPMAA